MGRDVGAGRAAWCVVRACAGESWDGGWVKLRSTGRALVDGTFYQNSFQFIIICKEEEMIAWADGIMELDVTN